MSDMSYQQVMKRQKKWMLYYLVLLTLAMFITSYQPFFNGLLLGTTVSLYNLSLLHRKIQNFSFKVDNRPKMHRLGTISRFATVGLAVIIGFELESYFHLAGIVLGLTTMFVVVIIDFALYSKQESDS
ncbi:ATP synthase subunit I [Paraliobacillus sp. JSM ZJ581]|uniref:ATP synthase subunit I n=1 Tax=Paraliobacillus sp. JSM ZJ581 TaxID=3342118 RepID=UPI0035A9AD4D